jgi:hypothetical protein
MSRSSGQGGRGYHSWKPRAGSRSYFAEAAAADDNRFNSSYVNTTCDAFPFSCFCPSPSIRENHRNSGIARPSSAAARFSSTMCLLQIPKVAETKYGSATWASLAILMPAVPKSKLFRMSRISRGSAQALEPEVKHFTLGRGGFPTTPGVSGNSCRARRLEEESD